MRKIQIILGEKNNRLTYLGEDIKSDSGKIKGKYKCDCGVIKWINNSEFKKGGTKSCGCLNRELSSVRLISAITTHGLSKTPLNNLYKSMKQRCYDKNCKSYAYYGLRGIKLCDEWLKDFTKFNKWCIDNGYKKGLEIDRINNDGNYEPNNCRFVTRKVNINNTSRNTFVYYYGERITIGMLSSNTGINYATLFSRIFKHNIIPEIACSLKPYELRKLIKKCKSQH